MTNPAHQPDAEPRPWEQPGAVRRDVAPHRGHWLLLLASGALVCGGAAFLFAVPAIPGIALGLVTVDMARRDLWRMAQGSLDPRGREQTVNAEQRALTALRTPELSV